jgi:hypothetical protein
MDASQEIGKMLNATLESSSDMPKQMADDPGLDAIMITGDLIDHRLTINEACLMYGPQFGYCESGNFNKVAADWFYNLPVVQPCVVDRFFNSSRFHMDRLIGKVEAAVARRALRLIDRIAKGCDNLSHARECCLPLQFTQLVFGQQSSNMRGILR